MNNKQPPAFTNAAQNQRLPGQDQLFNDILYRAKEGLTPDEMNIYTKQGTTAINNAYKTQQQRINEILNQNAGAVPIGFSSNANTGLLGAKSQALSDLMDKMALAKRQGKNEAYDLYSKIYGLALQNASMKNQYNLSTYDIQAQQGNPYLQLLGALISTGGQIGSAAIMA